MLEQLEWSDLLISPSTWSRSPASSRTAGRTETWLDLSLSFSSLLISLFMWFLWELRWEQLWQAHGPQIHTNHSFGMWCDIENQNGFCGGRGNDLNKRFETYCFSGFMVPPTVAHSYSELHFCLPLHITSCSWNSWKSPHTFAACFLILLLVWVRMEKDWRRCDKDSLVPAGQADVLPKGFSALAQHKHNL